MEHLQVLVLKGGQRIRGEKAGFGTPEEALVLEWIYKRSW